MKNKKNEIKENYLEKKPMKKQGLGWNKEKSGEILLEIQNKGIFNRIAQKLIKKPPVTYVHLDAMGSFIWPLIDGNRTIAEIGKEVHENFADDAEPLYERLAQYFKILENYNFIEFQKQ